MRCPASTDDVLRMRGRGWRPSYPLGSLEIATGLPLMTAFRWDTGVQVRVGPESLNAQRGAHQRHDIRSANARQQRRQTDRRARAMAAERRRSRSAASGATGVYVADAALANATLLAGTARRHAAGARRRRGILARPLDGARRADLEPLAGADTGARARRDERLR